MVGGDVAKEYRKLFIQLGRSVPGSMEFWVKQSVGELNAWLEAFGELEGADS